MENGLNTLFYGEEKPLPNQINLNSGAFEMVYKSGALRNIKLGNIEVIRMMYSAVRDRNWGTILPKITKEQIISDDDSFRIQYDCQYLEGDIQFEATYRITGNHDGKIRFEMHGEAVSDFYTNRTGFCLLHPISECAGKKCEITEPNGKKVFSNFPELISPWQPFKNIQSMRWLVSEGCYVNVKFEGDIFETEDQRNWTDDSYKTYCTPLELPFPKLMRKGETVDQAIEISLEGDPTLLINQNKPEYQISLAKNSSKKLPALGVCRSGEKEKLSQEDILLLKDIHLKHLRVDIKLFEKGWKDYLRDSIEEGRLLNTTLEVALHLPKESNDLLEFVKEFKYNSSSISSILLLKQGAKTTPEEVIALLPQLRIDLPGVQLGIGTDAYLTELNRLRPDPADADFISFSINPQVHAFDNSSLIENCRAQKDAIETALSLSKGKPVFVSPVTFKPRFNPDATGPEPPAVPGELSKTVDVRQMSLFGAGWTLGSLKHLSEAGAENVTFFETIGPKGLFMPQGNRGETIYPFTPHSIFPLYAVFYLIKDFSEAEVVPCESSAPLKFDALVLTKNDSMRIILANYTYDKITVEIGALSKNAMLKVIDALLLETGLQWFDKYKNEPGLALISNDNSIKVSLPSFALGVVNARR